MLAKEKTDSICSKKRDREINGKVSGQVSQLGALNAFYILFLSRTVVSGTIHYRTRHRCEKGGRRVEVVSGWRNRLFEFKGRLEFALLRSVQVFSR